MPNTQRLSDVVYHAPFLSPSGHGEDSRHNLFAMEEAGIEIAARDRNWSSDGLQLSEEEAERLECLTRRPHTEKCVQIVQDFAPHYRRMPGAAISILRTMFETD